MVVQEKYKDRFIKSYSDRGMKIRGGFPEGLYDVAIDPEEMHREYIETDIPIEDEEVDEDGNTERFNTDTYNRN